MNAPLPSRLLLPVLLLALPASAGVHEDAQAMCRAAGEQEVLPPLPSVRTAALFEDYLRQGLADNCRVYAAVMRYKPGKNGAAARETLASWIAAGSTPRETDMLAVCEQRSGPDAPPKLAGFCRGLRETVAKRGREANPKRRDWTDAAARVYAGRVAEAEREFLRAGEGTEWVLYKSTAPLSDPAAPRPAGP